MSNLQCLISLSSDFQIPPTTLESMLVHIELGYAQNGNPYHNHMHACDVLQTVHYFISQTGLVVRKFETKKIQPLIYALRDLVLFRKFVR